MYKSHTESTPEYEILLARAQKIADSIRSMREPGEFASHEMYELQNELSEILAQLAAEFARNNEKRFPREPIQGTKGLRASA